MEKNPEGLDQAFVQKEMPQGMERRLVLRLLAYWREIRGDENYPSFADVDPAKIPDLWPHCFVLETIGAEGDPIIRAVGDEIALRLQGVIVGRRVSELGKNSLFSVAIDYLDKVLDKCAPISHGGEFSQDDGTKILYRSIILPMSDDGETVSGLLCAANCRKSKET
jgi:hypothetical protein